MYSQKSKDQSLQCSYEGPNNSEIFISDQQYNPEIRSRREPIRLPGFNRKAEMQNSRLNFDEVLNTDLQITSKEYINQQIAMFRNKNISNASRPTDSRISCYPTVITIDPTFSFDSRKSLVQKYSTVSSYDQQKSIDSRRKSKIINDRNRIKDLINLDKSRTIDNRNTRYCKDTKGESFREQLKGISQSISERNTIDKPLSRYISKKRCKLEINPNHIMKKVSPKSRNELFLSQDNPASLKSQFSIEEEHGTIDSLDSLSSSSKRRKINLKFNFPSFDEVSIKEINKSSQKVLSLLDSYKPKGVTKELKNLKLVTKLDKLKQSLDSQLALEASSNTSNVELPCKSEKENSSTLPTEIRDLNPAKDIDPILATMIKELDLQKPSRIRCAHIFPKISGRYNPNFMGPSNRSVRVSLERYRHSKEFMARYCKNRMPCVLGPPKNFINTCISDSN